MTPTQEQGGSQNQRRTGPASPGRQGGNADLAPRQVEDPIPEGPINDPTLVARIESELFRDTTLPKGQINIDAANGVVTVRGTLEDQALATDIVERIGAVEGVVEVVNLLR